MAATRKTRTTTPALKATRSQKKPTEGSKKKKKKESKARMLNTVKLRPYDVICGRGCGRLSKSGGNLAFHELVKSHKAEYNSATGDSKAQISQKIVDLILERSGRFLSMDLESEIWEELSYRRAVLKTQQTFRDVRGGKFKVDFSAKKPSRPRKRTKETTTNKMKIEEEDSLSEDADESTSLKDSTAEKSKKYCHQQNRCSITAPRHDPSPKLVSPHRTPSPGTLPSFLSFRRDKTVMAMLDDGNSAAQQCAILKRSTQVLGEMLKEMPQLEDCSSSSEPSTINGTSESQLMCEDDDQYDMDDEELWTSTQHTRPYGITGVTDVFESTCMKPPTDRLDALHLLNGGTVAPSTAFDTVPCFPTPPEFVATSSFVSVWDNEKARWEFQSPKEEEESRLELELLLDSYDELDLLV